jgi:hypothetical protein
MTRDVAGYRKREGEGWDYYVTASAWQGEVCKGFNARTIAGALVAQELLLSPETGRHTCLVRVPDLGRHRLYHLSSKLLESGD